MYGSAVGQCTAPRSAWRTMAIIVATSAAETLAERQYQRGLITIFNLIDAQTRRISAERQLLNVRANRAANRINYHIALGGGALPLADLPNADMSTEGSTAP